MIVRYAAAVIAATWLIWQIPFSHSESVVFPEVFATTQLAGMAEAEGNPALFFYRKTEAGQYAAYGLTPAGSIARVLSLPGSTLTKADQSQINLGGKEGYLTGPENGAFFIWYPQLGSQVYVFNESGSLLWEKEESRYLQVLRNGRFILAAAGDHSRMIFMNPDFKVQADFQGVLFTQFTADDDPALKFGQACLGSLDGEVIVLHLDRRIYSRQRLGYALKAVACNFATGDLAAIVERTVTKDNKTRQADFLLRLKFNVLAGDDNAPAETLRQTPQAAEVISEAELPVRTVTASAMTVTPELICFVQSAPAEGNEPAAALYHTRHRKDKPQVVTLSAARSGAETSTHDRWKSTAVSLGTETGCLHAHASGRLVLGSARGLLFDRHDLGGERLLVTGKSVFLQKADRVFGLR
ncbi:MAG: hypothetical protein ACOY5B_05890 [Spirochaetota bacterium]